MAPQPLSELLPSDLYRELVDSSRSPPRQFHSAFERVLEDWFAGKLDNLDAGLNMERDRLRGDSTWYNQYVIEAYGQLVRDRSMLEGPGFGFTDSDTSNFPKVQMVRWDWLLLGIPVESREDVPGCNSQQVPAQLPRRRDGSVDCSLDGVARWTYRVNRDPTKNTDLFDCEYLFLPVILDKHWSLWVVDFVNNRFDHYCSLGRPPRKSVLELLVEMLRLEHASRNPDSMPTLPDFETFTTRYNPNDPPQQPDEDSCGVFVCLFMENISRQLHIDAKWDFEDREKKRVLVELYRKKIAFELLMKEITAFPLWNE